MRLVDYICSCEIYCPTRIACVGLSGGGLQSLWLAALDERIACAIVSGYFYGYKDSLLKLSENCSCNYLPHLWEAVDMGDIGALVAPRPLFIESGDQDYYNGERGVVNTTEQAQITRSAYRLLDAEENFFHHIFVGKHRWNGEKAYPFLQKNLSSISNYNTNLKTNS
jgi:pimeloyl-ACP methyl ester carboxylesterase